jgi:AhpD family alkylhydroperoxidase
VFRPASKICRAARSNTRKVVSAAFVCVVALPDRSLFVGTRKLIYLAVSVTNGCPYCIASHTAAARKAGISDAMFGELMAVVGMANETNRLANGYRVPIDPAFE